MIHVYALNPYFLKFTLQKVEKMFRKQFKWDKNSFSVCNLVFSDNSIMRVIDLPTDINETDFIQLENTLLTNKVNSN